MYAFVRALIWSLVVVSMLVVGAAVQQPDAVAQAGCAGTATVVSTSAELDDAIDCYNSDSGSSDHVITFGSDIVYATPFSGTISGQGQGDLLIDGAGQTLTTAGTLLLDTQDNATTIRDVVLLTPATIAVTVQSGQVTMLNTNLSCGGSCGPRVVVLGGELSVLDSDVFGTFEVQAGELALVDSVLQGGALSYGVQALGGSTDISQTTIQGFSLSGIQGDGGHLSISDSTIAGNAGAGVTLNAGVASVSNSTISNNDVGLAIGPAATVSISNATIANNTNSELAELAGFVGGGSTMLVSSIVGSTATPNCTGLSGLAGLVDGGGNFGTDATCGPGITALSAGSLDTSLSNNGGPTQTIALQSSSNAIGGGICVGVNLAVGATGAFVVGDLANDQRGAGNPRPSTACDAGAYEDNSPPPTPTPGPSPTPSPTPTPSPGPTPNPTPTPAPIPCPTGTSSPSGFVPCDPDPAPSGTPCAPGTSSPTGFAPCDPDPAGTPCPPGSFSATGSVPCDLAPVGTHVPTSGATSPTPCPAGTASLTVGAVVCRPQQFCAGQAVTIDMNANGGNGIGTAGDDVILGTPGADFINGGLGSDVVCAGSGGDTILGGDGDFRDFLYGGPGVDLINGGFGIDYIYGEGDRDILDGDGGSDRIYGGAGSDEMYGDSGADRMFGGAGNDQMRGMGGQDFMWGDSGNDVMQGNWQSDNIFGGSGNDELYGAGGKDSLFGESGDDTLSGGLNTDYLHGGVGTDTANGGRGRDKPLIAPLVRASNGQFYEGSGCVAETILNCQPTP